MSPVDKKHVEAVEFYTKAIDLNPGVASYYGNRSIAHLRTEAFGYALQDASKALELDKNYIKVRKPDICSYSMYFTCYTFCLCWPCMVA